ncbi:2-hydroxycarboxylate transporter family protein [Sporosarcina sp. ACRSM]|uniref:2-hydroxycarboxylate transporter family protein n=1 Tax=Sporosarcina sp. ACRSM TaxID=2918216 RepID=UPI001EF732FD|nr:2-hydroxycarboxylate transporter family protein [Sporosarcina sp. ACRSM]MCG7335059.1 2-hydroxycarboxylate transporter family protein [Sporosarcina sp. ACRSM]
MSTKESVVLNTNVEMARERKLTIAGINIYLFIGIVTIILIGIYMEVLPDNMASGLVVTMVLGLALKWIGDQIPVFNTFGGGAILCIIIPALFLYLGIFPQSFGALTESFFTSFADLAISGIVVGSILSMDRQMLLKVGTRYFIPLIGAIVATMAVGGLLGHLVGFGFTETIFFVVGPVMGGGMTAGAIPMAEIFAASSGESAGTILERIAPAVLVSNMICIILAGVLNGLGKRKKKPKYFSGDGEMLRLKDGEKRMDFGKKESHAHPFSINNLMIGIIFATTIFVLARILASVIPGLHATVWIILGAAALKIFCALPPQIEKATEHWYDFISKALVPAILVMISAGMIDFAGVVKIITDPSYLSLTVITVIIATLAAGFLGLIIGFYFVETAIAAGLGMADMGGSGDLAVLSAADRMELMPFLQISSRIGGAITLLILSFLAPLLL